MYNILKAWMRKNPLNTDPHDFIAQVPVAGSVGVSEIIDELLLDGVELNREQTLKIIAHFNTKAAQLVATGYNVNTGLVNMRPTVKGSFYNMKWNPTVNWIDVFITQAFDLSQAIAETKVQILGERTEASDLENVTVLDDNDSAIKDYQNDLMTTSSLKAIPEPACGIAFRAWLCQA
ncbi:MAG: DNA-binding domain-containing protein [Paludibacter sp.]|nr:DNA-binding domain-containing protein [Paludibacter sp.]